MNELLAKKYITTKDLTPYPELLQLGTSLGINNPRQILFHYLNQVTDIPACLCGNSLSWNSDARQYRAYCSRKCSATYSQNKRKLTSVEKYGVDHHAKLDAFKEKIHDTSVKKYGVNHYSKSEEFKQSVKSANLKKYGVEHPAQLAEIMKKMQDTCKDRWGVSNPAKSTEIREKIQKTNNERYGSDCVLASDTVKDKIKQTNLKKYGVANPQQNPDTVLKRVQTRKERYYDQDTLNYLLDPDWLTEQNSSGKSVGQLADELGVSSSNLYAIFRKHDVTPVKHFTSYEESVITDLLNEYEVEHIRNSRKIISPYELDIFIPGINLAIEINGGYWHHEDAGKHRMYHYNKYLKCQELGIELWNIFDWEIHDKLDILRSKILNKLNFSTKIFARKLHVTIVDNSEKSKFLIETHIQGDCASAINVGLSDGSQLYALMTFGKSRFNKKYQWEMLRYSTLKNHCVIGGGGKLIKHFVNHYMCDGDRLISYCNLRFSSGGLYKKLNFNNVGISPPNYSYVTVNGAYAGSRNQWQKHMLSNKLTKFDKSLTEVENMRQNGFHRIWDCGNLIFDLIKH